MTLFGQFLGHASTGTKSTTLGTICQALFFCSAYLMDRQSTYSVYGYIFNQSCQKSAQNNLIWPDLVYLYVPIYSTTTSGASNIYRQVFCLFGHSLKAYSVDTHSKPDKKKLVKSALYGQIQGIHGLISFVFYSIDKKF